MSLFSTLGFKAGYRTIPDGVSVAGTNPSMSPAEVTATGTQGLCVRSMSTVFPWNTGSTVATFVSDSADDDIAGGAGVQAVLVQGLDDAGKTIEEVVPLSGLTPVTSEQVFSRLNLIIAVQSGANQENSGEILASLDGSVILCMPPAQGISLSSHFSVPTDWPKGALVTRAWAVIASKQTASAVTRARIRPFGGPWVSTTSLATNSSSGELQHFFEAAVIVPPRGDLDLGVIDLDGNNIGISAGFDLLKLP